MKAIVNPKWNLTPEKIPQLTAYADKLSRGPWSHSHDIEDLLNKINSATHAEQIPTSIMVSYDSLLERNIDPRDVVDVIDLSSKIAFKRLGAVFNETIYSGTIINKIDLEFHKKLSSAGFRGCSLSPLIHGLDAAITSSSSYVTDDWHGMVISKPVSSYNEFNSLKINLTYRQNQIANLISHRGLTNHQIAKQLDISDSTVKMHIGIILKKYGVQHRTQLMLAMQEKMAK